MPCLQIPGVAVVVFDLDDTLYPEREFAYSGFKAVGEWLKERTPCPVEPAQRMRQLFETGFRGRVFNQLLTEWGLVDQMDIWLPQMIECYRLHEPEIRLHPDALRAIERWESIFQLSLISDGPLAMQRNKLKKLNLQNRLKPVIFTDQWGKAFWKPHRRAFEQIQTDTGHSQRQCVYIADNPAKDFLAPRRLGWHTICIRRPEGVYASSIPPSEGEPEYQITSMDDVGLAP